MLIAAPVFAQSVVISTTNVAPIVAGIAQQININPDTKLVFDSVTGQPVLDPVTGLQKKERTWANYMYWAKQGKVTHLQSVMLEKIHPERKVACGAGWNTDKNTVFQIGIQDVQVDWPLLYEVDGTEYRLTVTYTTDQRLAYPAPFPANVASRSHVEVYKWVVVSNTWEAFYARLDFFAKLPAGTCEVFAVTPAAKAKILTYINGFGSQAFGTYVPGILQYIAMNQKVAAATTFNALEGYIDAVCGECASGLYTAGLNAGTPNPAAQLVLDNATVPAASLLINDLWAVGKTLNILIDAK